LLDRGDMRRRFPMIDFDGIELGLWEPEFGALMARRAVQTIVAEFVAAGGEYRRGAVQPPERGRARCAASS
jgi:sarcosine oxidase